MKKTIAIIILLVLLLCGLEWGITFLKKEHKISYEVYYEDKVFEIIENYQKENGDSYDLEIKVDNSSFYYVLKNNYNKQKNIVKNIEYFKQDNDICIYPILEDEKGTYLQCINDNKLYTSSSFSNQNFISKIKTSLEEKGYNIYKTSNLNDIKKVDNSTLYINNLINKDVITLWNYKGIDIMSSDKQRTVNVLDFDKYENSHGYLVNHYYIIPNYATSRVQEFSSVQIININNYEMKTLDLGYTLSSRTYINGIVDNKLYYTDPSNLLQIEINPVNRKARLIGSKELGGQLYDGEWKDANIYDFVNNKIIFKKVSTDLEKYNYIDSIDNGASYYFYNSKGEVYELPKKHLDNPILLFKANGLNNLEIVDETIYYVVSDTLYYFNNSDGIIPVLKNNELRYNNTNRISVYRKS